MIDPLKVVIHIPCYDNKVEAALAGCLMAIGSEHLAGGIQFLGGSSDIAEARNQMAFKFRAAKQFDWMVFWDSDICASAQDFKILMDYPAHAPRNDKEAMMLASRREENPDGVTLNDKGQALIVCAEYSRKVETGDPARFGLGFCRIHRSVFDLLEAAVTDPPESRPRVGTYSARGAVIHDFFPRGPGLNGHWFGEDTGFFHLCRVCSIVPRIEQRTDLIHIGRKAFPYMHHAGLDYGPATLAGL